MYQIPAQYHNYAIGWHVNMLFCDNKCRTSLVSSAHFCTEQHITIILFAIFHNIFSFFLSFQIRLK